MGDAPSSPASRFGGALRSTAASAALAFALFLPLIGFDTVVNIRNELVLETRWLLLFVMVALLAGLRFLQILVIGPWFADLSQQGAFEIPAGVREVFARW